MKIYMTDEQAKDLADFLKKKRRQRAAYLGLDLDEYDWKHFAGEIKIGVELLRKLKDGRKGMNLSTARKLAKAFGDEVLVHLELFPGQEPQLKTK